MTGITCTSLTLEKIQFPKLKISRLLITSYLFIYDIQMTLLQSFKSKQGQSNDIVTKF